MRRCWPCHELTNENEGQRNDECEDVATDWLVVLAMSLGKEVQDFVDVVFTQCLRRDRAWVGFFILFFTVVKSNNLVVSQCTRFRKHELLTWKTLGALTREARADERVAENVPAMMRGPNPDTRVII